MTPPDWVQAMRARCAAVGDDPNAVPSMAWDHFVAHARSDVPGILVLTEVLAGALDALALAEDQYVRESGMTLSDPISDAVTIARQALALYHQGPGATTGGGDG